MKFLVTGAWKCTDKQLNKLSSLGHSVTFMQNETDALPCNAEEVEAVMEKSPKFAELCVFGGVRSGGQKDGSEDVVIKIVPTESILNEFPDDKELEKEIIKEVKEYSKRLSNFKRPTSILISKEPLPRTATKKVKRKEIKQEYDNK